MELRRIIARLLLTVPLLAAGLALGAPRPAAAAVACTSFVVGGTITESVVVPANAGCTLDGVTVRGGVTVEPGAGIAISGSEIRGSVTATATATASIAIRDSVVRGGVTVTGGLGMVFLQVEDSQVRGNLVLTGNTTHPGRPILVLGNTVRGSVVLRDNTATASGIGVQANAIGADLDCSGNSPAPIVDFGVPNTVEGVATGQCAGLVAP